MRRMVLSPALPHTAVVTVHYGDPSTTVACLRSLIRHAPGAIAIVSNNGPSSQADELAHAARGLYGDCARLKPGAPLPVGTRAAVIHNPGNRGFAAGCNAGLRAALPQASLTHAWLLNNDATVEAGALKALESMAATHSRAVLGASVVDADKSDKLQVAGGVAYCPATSRIRPAHAGEPLASATALPEPRLDYVYGASLYLPLQLVREAGLLDEGYFLYCEELDLCRRAQALGYSLAWCRECVVRHEVGGSIGREDTGTNTQLAMATWHEARSTLRFTRRHHPALLPTVLAARLLAKPLFLAARGRWRLIPAALGGALAGLTA